MSFPYYHGDGNRAAPETPVDLPVAERLRFLRPEDYLPDPGLVKAVNVALMLGQPLLVTGEPGTGKTQLAYSLAWELGFGEPLRFDTKTTSTARDLFYTYDALGRFQAVHSGVADPGPLAWLTWNALGTAILRANDEAAVADWLPEDFEHGGRRRSVVLIDEIDKAPRDFPNDLLAELDEMYFRVPELGNVQIAADPEMQPVVVITSNSEKDLPDAFLRRMVYYHIPFPERTRLVAIVESRLGRYAGGSSAFLAEALNLFDELRRAPMIKRPATAELLDWLVTLRQRGGEAENPLAADPTLAIETLSNLAKTAEDQAEATRVVKGWIESRTT